jgi:hypothetical protein
MAVTPGAATVTIAQHSPWLLDSRVNYDHGAYGAHWRAPKTQAEESIA